MAFGSESISLPCQEAQREGRFKRLGGPPRAFDRRLHLDQREPYIVERNQARVCEFDAADAATHQLGRRPDLRGRAFDG